MLGGGVTECINLHYKEIDSIIKNAKRNYLKYLKNLNIKDKAAIVDQGFHGNNQRYLIKLLNKQLDGFYFCANLSDKNPNTRLMNMQACFQDAEDKTASKCKVLQYMIFVESYMTAPFGMAKSIDNNGNFIYAEPKNNQRFFAQKEKINNGVKQFITDYYRFFDADDEVWDYQFVDKWYGFCCGGTIEYSDAVKSSFYNDNAMMNRLESALFY